MFEWLKPVTTVGVDELAAKLAEGTQVLIDVREPHEFKAGHVKGAVNIPLGQLESRLDGLDQGSDTYVICRSGHRSATAVRLLKRAGFERVHSVRGGTSAWPGKLAR